MPTQTIRIATRRSPLAIWQAEYVKNLLCETHGDLECTLVPLQTRGDERLEEPLSKAGGKGLFLKELEVALLDQDADLAVHSMKDVPVTQPEGLKVHTIGQRGSAHDVWISTSELMNFPENGRVGTSSSRRKALFSHTFKRGQFVDIRGNVQTRLKKLGDGEVDALVLAEAGLSRLALEPRVRIRLPLDVFVPAAGQGALAVEYLDERREISNRLQPLIDDSVELAVLAERNVVIMLNADCSLPFGAHCERVNDRYALMAVALSIEGDHAIYAKMENSDWKAASEAVASRLDKLGASRLLGTA